MKTWYNEEWLDDAQYRRASRVLTVAAWATLVVMSGCVAALLCAALAPPDIAGVAESSMNGTAPLSTDEPAEAGR